MKVWGKFSEFIGGDIILNWNILTKCCLVLILGALNYLLWILWYLFVFNFPTLKYWMNVDLFSSHLIISIIIFFLYLCLAFISWKFKNNTWIKHYFPYICIFYFGSTLIYGGFNVGIISPATIGSYVSLISVGVVLFDRKIIYSTAVPVTIFMLSCIVLSSLERIPYAPLFSQELNSTILSENPFWVCSMLILSFPILIFSIVLFEILLTQWRNREAHIQTMSLLDPLTNIFNRRSLAQRLSTMQLEQTSYTLVLLDLDHFKMINDTYGHDVGDLVLTKVAKLLDLHLAEDDMAGRFGGEEFLLILQNKTEEHVIAIAEQCRKLIEREPILLDLHHKLHVTASFGVARSDINKSKELVLRQADQALYLAKHKGRNQVRYYTEMEHQEDVLPQ
ncbi:GGDEF domain-containing protein [Acinetobacter sp. CFCC 10889]|uniref:GGDEF domain-containing protein n=1 Tax=Acinetobacter sp. CFCC 10889 TaxID=1775557 RepID=UPI000DD0BEE7|nr:GGDEF domain-containing protein [Acinetobacter sp. CFCC 10889]